jgi:hypothetical protein
MPGQQLRTTRTYTVARRMEQAGWQPIPAPIPISSRTQHHGHTAFAGMLLCALAVALVLVVLHADIGSLW